MIVDMGGGIMQWWRRRFGNCGMVSCNGCVVQGRWWWWWWWWRILGSCMVVVDFVVAGGGYGSFFGGVYSW